MSFEEIKDDLRDLEAIREYPTVKKALADCKAAKKDGDEKYDKLMVDVHTLSDKATILGETNRKQEDELSKRVGESKDAKATEERLEKRITHLEGLKVTSDGKTLLEAEAAFVKAEDAEVERRATGRLAEIKERWESAEKPKQVDSAAIIVLAQTLEILRRPGIPLSRAEVARATVPDIVRNILLEEVERKFDEEEKKRIEDKASAVAESKLKHLIAEAWPRFLREHVHPKALELASVFNNGLLVFIGTVFTFECEKCGTTQQLTLNSMELAELIRRGEFFVPCVNPECKDWWSRHNIRVTLVSLIEAYLGARNPPPAS